MRFRRASFPPREGQAPCFHGGARGTAQARARRQAQLPRGGGPDHRLRRRAIVGYRRRRGQKTLPAGRKAANIALAGIRAIGERGNSQLKCWKVLAGDYRGSPTQITLIVKAVQAVQYLIRDPFGTAHDHGSGY